MYTIKDYTQQARIAQGLLDRKVYCGPWNVQIDLTNRCNNDCIACWCNSPFLGDKAMKEEVKKQHLTYETAINLIDELADLGTRDIYFTGGGEPFMHPRILDIMRHVKQRGMRLGMSTNFTLVTKEKAEELVDIGIDHMNLSMWAATPEMYVIQHPSKNEDTFRRMSESIDYIYKLKKKTLFRRPKLGMYNVINASNCMEVTDMLEFAFKHKMDDISYVPVDTIPDGTDKIQLKQKHRDILKEQVVELAAKAREFKKKYKHSVTFTNLDVFTQRITSEGVEQSNYDTELLSTLPSCYAGWSFARVLANGDVNSCLKSFKIPIGNIKKDSFTDIWFGEKQKEFRKHTIDYDINDPYFKQMGNDMLTQEQGCYKCCDNLGINMSIHKQMEKINPPRKLLIKLATRFLNTK